MSHGYLLAFNNDLSGSICHALKNLTRPNRAQGLTLGYTLLYLSIIVLIPLSAAFMKTATIGWTEFWHTISAPRVVASYRLTFTVSFLAALANMGFGLLVAWVLVRYRFPGRKLLDAVVDLPFALPTAVAGIALTSIYAKEGIVGR